MVYTQTLGWGMKSMRIFTQIYGFNFNGDVDGCGNYYMVCDADCGESDSLEDCFCYPSAESALKETYQDIEQDESETLEYSEFRHFCSVVADYLNSQYD